MRIQSALFETHAIRRVYDEKTDIWWFSVVDIIWVQEMADQALSLDRARETRQKHGRSEKWIQQRMIGQETRNKLTDYWADHNIKKGEEFAILTR